MDETFGHLYRLLDSDIESFCGVLSDLNENVSTKFSFRYYFAIVKIAL